jgi:hypothetical protein
MKRFCLICVQFKTIHKLYIVTTHILYCARHTSLEIMEEKKMKIIRNLKQPGNKEECESIWCEECVYDKKNSETIIECEAIKQGWV